MKLSAKIKNLIILSTCYIIALLFIYAAASKIIDFENFQVQLGQSPMLSAFANIISYAVPITEIIISLFLFNYKYRLIGLIVSFALMIMFTSYIYIILNYSSFVPCSCGGLLEELSWNQHILFNMGFVILISFAIYLTDSKSLILKSGIGKSMSLLFVGLASFLLVFLLYSWSENIMHYHNNFVRRFPHFPAISAKELQLTSDKFYFAGADTNKIFLGDYSAPLKIIEVDSTANFIQHSIKLSRKNLPFNAIQVKVLPPIFFLVDGNVPAVFQGKIKDWKANYKMRGKSYFSVVQPLDSSKLIFRATLKSTKTNALGRFDFNDTTKLFFNTQLIQKQIDGVFDTDGQLHYDNVNQKIVYLYTHRNQYIISDDNFKLIYRGNTIDTNTIAKLDIVTVKSNGETKMKSPPLIVNKSSALSQNLLFVNSQLPGQYESLEMWKKASIIDIYNINEKKYIFSFYIYNVGNKSVKGFYVKKNYLYALIDDKLIIYKLRTIVTDNYRR